MRIVKAFPPNYSDIKARFPIAGKDVLFAYGDMIFNPRGGKVSPQLVAHEEMHGRRQASDPAIWWKNYLEDAEFRLREEVVAHQAEYRRFCEFEFNGKRREGFLRTIASRLSAPMYGGLISTEQAMQRILG